MTQQPQRGGAESIARKVAARAGEGGVLNAVILAGSRDDAERNRNTPNSCEEAGE